jgi:hypothetical protein
MAVMHLVILGSNSKVAHIGFLGAGNDPVYNWYGLVWFVSPFGNYPIIHLRQIHLLLQVLY